MVFFDQLQVDLGGGVFGVIEFAAVDAEELEGLIEVGCAKLGKAGVGGFLWHY
ncbi:hypothetical protein [Argonema antarcticum]|uniref:hypothetical protein n=1 Tax=Argonema antarcticum TaxID=2942763 RepID=UPI002012592E|nr:hypothetical protein [Argonema antarcticum]MCL1470049.1 hypothetical protein [Argonema antarcticum A004/B2]